MTPENSPQNQFKSPNLELDDDLNDPLPQEQCELGDGEEGCSVCE